MIALGVRYLTGRSVSTDLSRQRAEWPPHPGRVFMALAAAHFETGAPPEERAALEWLESQPPPDLRASPAHDRSLYEVYVPVNDGHGGILRRSRQARRFPSVRPESDCLYLIWHSEPSAETRAALQALAFKLTRIGHSSSLVRAWIVETGSEPQPNWLADPNAAREQLRVPEPGLLRYLEECFNGNAIEEYFRLEEAIAQAKGKAAAALKKEMKDRFGGVPPQAARPVITAWQGYRQPDAAAETGQSPALSPFDPDFIVLTRNEGRVLGLESTLQLTRALRHAVMKSAPEPLPEWLTGHNQQGSPSQQPHLAYFPLPFVGAEHADGHVMGLAIAVPRALAGVSPGSRREALRTYLGPLLFAPGTGAPRPVTLWREGIWKWTLERETRERPPITLQRATWNGPSDLWASVTPVVLHHYPKKNRGEDVERIVREAFRTAMLPDPRTLYIRSASAHLGAGHARGVPFFEENAQALSRFQTHVIARFDRPVQGPMLIGRGRYRGYGLFRPLREGADRWQ